MTGVLMFFAAIFLLLLGFPVAFTFAGVALVVGVMTEGLQLFSFMPFRIYSIMQNTVLMAIPLFIFMGVVLQKTQLAEQLLESMGKIFYRVRGGLAISTVLVGALLAASTGVVGASVVAMGLISLPVMLKYGYCKRLAAGTICGAGTLGQVVPPSIVLIILGDVMGIPVGNLFQAALIPGLVLIGSYLVYIFVYAWLNEDVAPAIDQLDESLNYWHIVQSILPPLLLIIVILGSIFSGLATPTESSALGGLGAILLAIFYGKFNWMMLFDSALETVKVTAMIFAILIGATAFSLVFTYTGGDVVVGSFMTQLPGEVWGFVLLSMIVIFVLGFFIDFVEISFIVVPILVPVAETLGVNLVWFAILIAMNLQTSFLTPPFGFSLFYLKGVARDGLKTIDIYRGVIPFIFMQLIVLSLVIAFPKIFFLSF